LFIWCTQIPPSEIFPPKITPSPSNRIGTYIGLRLSTILNFFFRGRISRRLGYNFAHEVIRPLDDRSGVDHVHLCVYTEHLRTVPKKEATALDFDNNFGKCGPIFKILSLADSWENSLCTHSQRLSPHLRCVATLPCESRKFKKNDFTDFDSILNELLTCSWGHFEHLI